MQYSIVQYSIAGANLRNVQYSIVRERAPGLPWAYGGTPAAVSQFVELGQAEPR